MTASLLEISGLQSGYGEVQVLWGIDLDVAVGEVVCVIGSNGAGKTTLLRTISGLVPVSAGKIAIAGHDFTGATPAQVLSAGVAHVPEGRRLFSVMSVEDNLRMGAHMRSDDAEIRRDLVSPRFHHLGNQRLDGFPFGFICDFQSFLGALHHALLKFGGIKISLALAPVTIATTLVVVVLSH